jgi:hypothetical protein
MFNSNIQYLIDKNAATTSGDSDSDNAETSQDEKKMN